MRYTLFVYPNDNFNIHRNTQQQQILYRPYRINCSKADSFNANCSKADSFNDIGAQCSRDNRTNA
jgi:hypothetical protein